MATTSPVSKPLTHGRPRLPSKQDLLDFAFGVPDSPPMHTGRKNLTDRISKLIIDDDASSVKHSNQRKGTNSSVQSQRSTMELSTSGSRPQNGVASFPGGEAPFPDAEECRHRVCNDSLQPWSYLMAMPGKNIRDMLIGAFNEWIGCDEQQLITVKQAVAYLHSASLIVDDIEDESLTRRGFPAAHVKFGVAPSLNAANYVYFLALEKVLTLQSTLAVQAFTSEMCNLHRGQGRDIHWRLTSHIASEKEYIEMVQDKTGGLFRLALRVMNAVAIQPTKYNLDSNVEDKDDLESLSSYSTVSPSQFPQLIELSNNLASFFQIRDDLINLASPEFHKKKGFCEDITEGKLSFIALHSLRALKGTKKYDELLDILNMKTTDPVTIRRALAIMEGTKSFSHCLTYLSNLRTSIESTIKKLGGNKQLLDVVKTLAVDLEDCHDVQKRVIDAK